MEFTGGRRRSEIMDVDVGNVSSRRVLPDLNVSEFEKEEI